MSFFPLLPGQILLNNVLTDTPMIAVSTDNVDAKELKKPRHWNIGNIVKLSALFGFVSSVFDIITIAFLVYIIQADAALFRTSWFLESGLSEIIIMFSVRSHLPFFKSSRPSNMLIIVSLLTIILTLVIIYTPLGALFQLQPLPLWLLGTIGIILLTYFATVELLKSFFYKCINKE
jgi:Mg2+-importing ATPase